MTNDLIQQFNVQIKNEFYSANLYLSFSIQLDKLGLKGCSHWMLQQYHEELSHGLDFINYMKRRGASAEILGIEQPIVNANEPYEFFEAALAHEKLVSASINKLMTLARQEDDYATQDFLFGFVREQVEEEDTLNEIIGEMKLAKDSPAALLRLNEELLARPAFSNAKSEQ